MTKLAEKLIQLGYERDYCDFNNSKKIIYRKFFQNTNECEMIITFDTVEKKIIYSAVQHWLGILLNQQDIDNLQLSLEELQNDLEVLKECD